MLSEEFVFHHIGVAVPKLQEAIPSYRDLFGYQLTSGPVDDPIQKVSVCFLSRGQGDPVIELVAPMGPGSPVVGTLKKGGGVYHVCYQVPDIRASIKQLINKGCYLISGPDPAMAFNQREIAWLMTGANLLIELLQA